MEGKRTPQDLTPDEVRAIMASTNEQDEGTLAERLVGDVPVHLPAPGEFRPEPGEQFQIMRGYQEDDTIFRVDGYAPITAAPEKVQELYSLPELPNEEVHAKQLERHGDRWVGTRFRAFPTTIMVAVGSTRAAFSAANGGAAKPRAPRTKGSGRCEHCGEKTGGGRFRPGHDAKLKGDLNREAASEDDATRRGALAEAEIRSADSAKWAVPVPAADRKYVDTLIAGEGFLQSRIAARQGEEE